MEKQRYIAETILAQIKAFDPFAMMAYGAKNLVILNETHQYSGGLSFKVNGFRHKGTVEIALMFNDTYRVRTFNRTLTKIKDEVKDVYFEDLVQVLDSLIEDRKAA